MALVPCPECDKKVSTSAKACPNCGVELDYRNATNHTTIEFTSKKLKAHRIISITVMIISFLLAGMWKQNNNEILANVSMGIFFTALIWFGITKIRVWWNHS